MLIALDDDWKTIKHIQYNKSEKLGDGSEGTIVYRGRLDDSFEIREKVAVKRLLKEKHKIAQKEDNREERKVDNR